MDFSRQFNLLNTDKARDTSVVIIGAGGIGSPTAICLAKMGIGQITLVDFDNVEKGNLPNQLYRHKDLGWPKVQALQSIIIEYAPLCQVIAINEKFTNNSPIIKADIVIMAVDNMRSRKIILDKYKYTSTLVIDGRMGGLFFKIYTCMMNRPMQVEKYLSTWHTDANGAITPCGEKSILFNIFGIASWICSIVRSHIQGEEIHQSIIMDFKTLFFQGGDLE